MDPNLPLSLHGPAHSGTLADRNKLDEVRGDIRGLREAVDELQRRLEKQAVLVRALFEFLSATLGLTEAELVARFRDVELAKAGATPRKCPDCGRGVNQRTHRCIYCGAACAVQSAFELLELGAWPTLGLQPAGPASRACDGQSITTRPGG
jgi:hypothetical protein